MCSCSLFFLLSVVCLVLGFRCCFLLIVFETEFCYTAMAGMLFTMWLSLTSNLETVPATACLSSGMKACTTTLLFRILFCLIDSHSLLCPQDSALSKSLELENISLSLHLHPLDIFRILFLLSLHNIVVYPQPLHWCPCFWPHPCFLVIFFFCYLHLEVTFLGRHLQVVASLTTFLSHCSEASPAHCTLPESLRQLRKICSCSIGGPTLALG